MSFKKNVAQYFSSTFICGGPRSGKTNHAMNITKILIEDNVLLFIIDPTKAWKKKFDQIGKTIIVSNVKFPSINWNAHYIFDTSRLDAEKQCSFIEQFSHGIMNVVADEKRPPRRMVIIEECHTPVPPNFFRSRKAANTVRLLTQGRHFGIHFMTITQFPTLCDNNLVKLTPHRYFFHLDKKRDIAYVKDFLADNAEQLPTLNRGECFFNYGNEAKRMTTPLFGKAPPRLPPIKAIEEEERYKKKFPQLMKAIRDASPPLLILNRRSHAPYLFNPFPFGELGCNINHNLINEIGKGLFEKIQKFKQDFDYIVCLPSGDKWVFPIVPKLKKDIKRFYERPGELRYSNDTEDLLRLPDEKHIHLKTLIYEKDLYFRGDIKAGDKVIIIDDVVSTGETMKIVIKKLKEWGLNVIGVFCIVAKGQQYKVIEDELKVPVQYLVPLGFT